MGLDLSGGILLAIAREICALEMLFFSLVVTRKYGQKGPDPLKLLVTLGLTGKAKNLKTRKEEQGTDCSAQNYYVLGFIVFEVFTIIS